MRATERVCCTLFVETERVYCTLFVDSVCHISSCESVYCFCLIIKEMRATERESLLHSFWWNRKILLHSLCWLCLSQFLMWECVLFKFLTHHKKNTSDRERKSASLFLLKQRESTALSLLIPPLTFFVLMRRKHERLWCIYLSHFRMWECVLFLSNHRGNTSDRESLLHSLCCNRESLLHSLSWQCLSHVLYSGAGNMRDSGVSISHISACESVYCFCLIIEEIRVTERVYCTLSVVTERVYCTLSLGSVSHMSCIRAQEIRGTLVCLSLTFPHVRVCIVSV